MTTKTIIGRVGNSVLLFQTKDDVSPYGIVTGTKIYSLSNFLCFVKFAPGELFKVNGKKDTPIESGTQAEYKKLVNDTDFEITNTADFTISPSAEIVVKDFYDTFEKY